MTINTTDSLIKKELDNWYKSNISEEDNVKVEDTIWCNDRTLTAGTFTGAFGAFTRNVEASTPLLSCPSGDDSFTMDSTSGNGKLTYPVGLLTADELTLAGSGYTGYSTASYLNTGQAWWTMSPSFIPPTTAQAFVLAITGNGKLEPYGGGSGTKGIRPAISLKVGTTISGGNGSTQTPYIVN